MEKAELGKIGFQENFARLREDAGRIAGRLLLAAGMLVPTAVHLAETERPAEAASNMTVQSGNNVVEVATECDNNQTPNLTTVMVRNRGNDIVDARLRVKDKDIELFIFPGGDVQRHKFATVENDMPITVSTTSPGSASNTMVSDCRRRQDAPLPPEGGYSLIAADGKVIDFGMAPDLTDTSFIYNYMREVADLEATPSGNGYYITYPNGFVTSRNAPLPQGLTHPSKGESVVSTSVTSSGNGLWRFTDKGDVLTTGDAVHYGSMKGVPLNGPILDSKTTPSGRGYWSIASDGGVFSFGDARFHGSMGDRPLNKPVVGMAPDPDGAGYWLVAADGGIFAFDAPFRGSMGDRPLNKPVIGAVPYGNGYLMIAEDGGVFNFSDKPFVGSLGNNPPAYPVVDIAPLPPHHR